MGQRANYILIENSLQTIYYNHWRANCITSDLYLGEKRFINFVRSCKVVTVLLNEVWIEGCVIINIDKKTLYFWSLEFGTTSASNFYLKKVQGKWKNWSVNLVYNKMYDFEEILNIDYISQQEQFPLSINTADEIINDKVSEFGNTIIIIKTPIATHITQLGNVSLAGILNFGEAVVDILLNKKEYPLPKEEEEDKVFATLIIDTVHKTIIIDNSEFGLREQCQGKWDGYNFKMGDFGYIGALALANINTGQLSMTIEQIKIAFNDLVKPSKSFDPIGFARKLLNENKDIKFSPSFFDSVKPQPNFIGKINRTIGKLFSTKKDQ
ncbi:hypothetical protein SAMN05192574_104131 [Mucilaginibacter gossypiicola]|uniref:Uncharacterized protein n=1 Tax=Mucilaginibacter gossypiicola TaxID=551995 RepID=A0A1H8JDD1_9SPHI|nr:hypothetical protein [Mucilaginibacter gossypiicola]SEN78336.1 hypothetical protein SAMN05192574_104131 [Mucilaginibacter gossypiicola]